MVPYRDFIFYTTLAQSLHAILFWHVWTDGTYQPFMLPVSDDVWRLIIQ